MILVSLSSYCQYPVTKIIGKDTVVVMTVKQAEEINKKFLDLRDSINSLGKTITVSKVEIDSLKFQKQKLDSNLVIASDKILTSGKQVEDLSTSMKDLDSRYWREKKMTAGWMILSFLVFLGVTLINQ